MADFNLSYTGAQVDLAIGRTMGEASSTTTIYGYSAGSTSVGINCTAYGRAAGSLNMGDGATALGAGAGESNMHSNSLVINADGAQNLSTASKQIIIGRSDYDVQIGDGTVSPVSDARDKFDIVNSPIGLDFIKDLTPCFYKYDIRELYEEVVDGKMTKKPSDGTKSGKRDHAGLIAQEVKAVMDSHGVDFGLYIDRSKAAIGPNSYLADDKLALRYSELIPVLIKAVQELSTKIETLEGK